MLIYDLAEAQELVNYTRQVQDEVDRNRFTLSNFLPNQDIDDIEFRVTQGDFQDMDVAEYRAWDTESPIGGRQGVSRLMGEIIPISKKIPLTEELRLRKRAMERGNNRELVDRIFDDARNLARSIAAAIERKRGEALVTGALDLNENGLDMTIDFGRDASHEDAPAVLWSDAANSTPIEDLKAWGEVYEDTNDGVTPRLWLVSSTIVANLLRNDSFRTYAGSLAGTPDLLTLPQVANVLRAHGIPPLVEYNTRVRVNGTSTRVIPDNFAIALPPRTALAGSTFFGTTAEALELVGARQIAQDDAPGLVAVVDKTFDPVQTWTKVAGVNLPILINPNLTFVADVL